MKTSLPATVFACTLVCTSQLVSATSEGCAEQKQRNTDLGHAIGVLVFDNIVKEYKEFAKVEDIAAGLELASGGVFPLPISIVPNPDSKYTLTVAEAESIVSNWRPQSDDLAERFSTAFKQRGKQKERGILARPLEYGEKGSARLSECISNFTKSTEGGLKQVCYMQLQIDNESVCDMEGHVNAELVNQNARWIYGEFNQDHVIAGWVEVFKLLETDSDMFKIDMDLLDEHDGESQEKEFVNLLEVVIPPGLAYGEKGMIGKVEPSETLWFFMAVR